MAADNGIKTGRRDSDDDEVEIDIRIERPRSEAIDRARGAIETNLEDRFGGIDSATSVFDSGAVFRTTPKE
ncbi:MAG: hypothetical protein LBL63_07325 [Clostridiales Family XIII bacterium]|jgi:hypothetical protein|nr:hypothetical protein [Clostridiales Family XIII bacterium]